MDAKQEEIDNAAARLPVTHLVLCVHGIGQNLIAANIAGAPLANPACRVTHIWLLLPCGIVTGPQILYKH